MSVRPFSLDQWTTWCTSRPRVAAHSGLRHLPSRRRTSRRVRSGTMRWLRPTLTGSESATKTGLITPSQVHSRAMASGTAMPLIHVARGDRAGSRKTLTRKRSRRSIGLRSSERPAMSTRASTQFTSLFPSRKRRSRASARAASTTAPWSASRWPWTRHVPSSSGRSVKCSRGCCGAGGCSAGRLRGLRRTLVVALGAGDVGGTHDRTKLRQGHHLRPCGDVVVVLGSAADCQCRLIDRQLTGVERLAHLRMIVTRTGEGDQGTGVRRGEARAPRDPLLQRMDPGAAPRVGGNDLGDQPTSTA